MRSKMASSTAQGGRDEVQSDLLWAPDREKLELLQLLAERSTYLIIFVWEQERWQGFLIGLTVSSPNAALQPDSRPIHYNLL